MESQLHTTAPESNRKGDASTDDLEESAFLRRRWCCAWSFPCYGTPKVKIWERISTSESEHHEERRSWWSDGVEAFKKVREWSELVAGPKWKTFIRRLNRAPPRPKSGKFHYDPSSYALNFDQGPGQNGQFEDDGVSRDFPSRYAAIPAHNKDAAPLTCAP